MERATHTHALICVSVEMMDFIPPIQHICHHLRRWFIHDGRRYDIRHIAKIAILGDIQGWVRIETTYSTEMNVSPVMSLSSSIGNSNQCELTREW